MSELRPVLERLRDRIETPSEEVPPLESLHRRRHRRAIRRRITAAAVASVVAVAGVGVVIRAFDRRVDHPREPTAPELAPRITATFPVGTRGQVDGVIAAFGSVWVTAYGVPGGGGPDGAAVLRVDPSTNQVADTVPLLGVSGWTSGGGGVAAGAGAVWVTGGTRIDGEQEGVLSRVDPSSLDVESIVLGGEAGSGDVSVSDDGVWVTGRRGDAPTLTHVDPTTGEIDVPKVLLRGETARQVSATDSAVVVRGWDWHGNQGPCGLLTSVDPELVTTVAEQPGPDECAGIGGLFRWGDDVWTSVDGGFARVDPATAEPTGPVHPFTSEYAFPRSAPVIDDSGVWFGAYPGGNGSAPDQLSRFDPSTGRIETFDVEVGWVAAAALDGTIWALDYDGNLRRIDLFEASSPSQASPTSMTIEHVFRYSPEELGALSQVVADDDSVWVLDTGAYHPDRPAAVVRLDPATGRILSRTEVSGASDLTVLGESVWVVRRGEGGGGWVTQVDRGSGVPLGSIALPRGSYGGPILAYEGDLWVSAAVADIDGNRLEIIRIDPGRAEIVSEIPAPVCTVFEGGCYPNTELVGEGGAVWAAGSERGETIRIDVGTERVDVLRTGAVAGFATEGDRVWIATQAPGEATSAARWWDGQLELVALEARSGQPVEGPIPMSSPGWLFTSAGVPFAAAGGTVIVWGVNGDELILARIEPDGTAVDAVGQPGDFLEGGRAIYDQQRNVIWVVGSYELTRIALPGP